jgi:hypothetical protein
MMKFPIYGMSNKKSMVPNHQPVVWLCLVTFSFSFSFLLYYGGHELKNVEPGDAP